MRIQKNPVYFAWQYYKRKFNEYSAAAILGAMFVWTALNPKYLQDGSVKGYSDGSYTRETDDGTYKDFETDGAGYGLMQWYLPTQKRKLLEYAKTNNASVGDFQLQTVFFAREVKEDFKEVYELLCRADCVDDAVIAILLMYLPIDRITDDNVNVISSVADMYYRRFALKEIEKGSI